jgi:hypothetical protein
MLFLKPNLREREKIRIGRIQKETILAQITPVKYRVMSFVNYQQTCSKLRAFHPVAHNQFPANPLIVMIERRHGEIFKVRNPIRNIHDKSVAILYSAVVGKMDFKDSEMNKGGE